jgi:hypothetical protein
MTGIILIVTDYIKICVYLCALYLLLKYYDSFSDIETFLYHLDI